MKEFIKSFFFTDTVHFPQHFFDQVLPASIRSLYLEYYLHGTGALCITVLLVFAFFHVLLAKKSRWLSFLFFVSLFVFTPINEFMTIQHTSYLMNVLHLPFVHIPQIFLLFFYSLYSIFLLFFFFKKTRYHLSPKVNLFLISGIAVFLIFLFFPLFTGELWMS